MTTKNECALSIGIDLGTTTVSAVAYDMAQGKTLQAYCVPHRSYVCDGARSEQSVDMILECAMALISKILDTYGTAQAIGITGQMHGIVYIDKDAQALSNLINWQDKRADEMLDGEMSACQIIEERTHKKIYAGYGVATHYHNMLTGTVPQGAVGVCSIMDLLCMRLCKNKRAICHASVAASLGLFDMENGDFDTQGLSALGIDRDFLPQVTNEVIAVGKFRGIPVCAPIGDNQASFFGSVAQDERAILINIGTGSQACTIGDECEGGEDIELRPFFDNRHLICGSALCGGFAYSMLEAFFRAYTESDEPQYEKINRLARQAYERGERAPVVDTCFCGKRSAPQRKGAILELDRESFTPSALALGVLNGMVEELYGLCRGFLQGKDKIVASGGAVRRNPLLRELLSKKFSMPVFLSEVEEESATGAAALCAKILSEE